MPADEVINVDQEEIWRFRSTFLCKLGEDFLADLCEDFARHGAAAIERVRQEDPATYLRVVASLVPKEVKVETHPLAGWTEAELHALAQAAQKAVALAEARETKQLEHASTGADIS